MRKSRLRLILACLTLAGLASAYVLIGLRLYQTYHLAYANYQLAPSGPCGALIAWTPPTLLYTGFYVNQPTLLELRYRSPNPQTLRITVSIPGLTQEQTIQVQAANAFQQRAFKPPLLDTATLDSFVATDQRPALIHLSVQSATGALCDTSAPLTLKSRQWIRWFAPTGLDNAPYLVGWVTPHAPVIDTLINRTAQWIADHPATYANGAPLTGYAGAATPAQLPNQTRAQVNALFDTLEQVYHLRYAADNVLYTTDGSQRIQLPQDILTHPQPTAMCIETTTLLASAIERLGMRPYIIITPGHAYLGVALGPDPASPIAYWETSALHDGIDGAQANIAGDDEYTQDSAHNTISRIIDVTYWRQQGVTPIE